MNNRICKELGIQYPVFQGAMQWIADSSLVAAVSSAGGLGVLATALREKEDMRAEIEVIRRKTRKPFAVNISMLSRTVDDIADLVIEENVKIVVTAAGNPQKYLERWKKAGIKIISVVATVPQAVKMEKLGADIIVAEGQESGGHIGEMTTMALVPQIVKKVRVPVVAAGGIADGRGMAASFILGASGIQMGTIFLPCKECTVHPNFKKAVLNSESENVVAIGRSGGHACRIMNNEFAAGFFRLDEEHAPSEAYTKWNKGALRRAVIEGDVNMGSVMMGQIVGLVDYEDTVKETILRVLSEYNMVRDKLIEI